MILADSSAWIDMFRAGLAELERLLVLGEVVTHDFVIGELACGNLRDRDRTLGMLQELPRLDTAQNSEVLHLVHANKLYGTGLGWIDLHLLAAAKMHNCPLFTPDLRLGAAARKLRISYRHRAASPQTIR
jgi:predicted nucleic acid-binding protein